MITSLSSHTASARADGRIVVAGGFETTFSQSTLDSAEVYNPAGDSWIEVWPEGPGMPAGIMLQIVVDDADAWAERARANGLKPQGPTDAHGERIYYLQAPGGLPIAFQSRLPGSKSE